MPDIQPDHMTIRSTPDEELMVLLGTHYVIMQADRHARGHTTMRQQWHPDYGLSEDQWHYPESTTDVVSIEWASHGTRTWMWPITGDEI